LKSDWKVACKTWVFAGMLVIPSPTTRVCLNVQGNSPVNAYKHDLVVESER
jgi:hypothetical protein